LYIAVRRTFNEGLKFVQGAYQRGFRRKYGKDRIGCHSMSSDRGLPIINRKAFLFHSEKLGINMISKAAINNGRRTGERNMGRAKGPRDQ